MSERAKNTARGATDQQQLHGGGVLWRPRIALILWGGIAAVMLAAFAVAVFLAGTGSDERPYVGGDFHGLAVDPADPRKVMVGGHGGGAMSRDGGATWEQIEDLNNADPMGWVVSSQDPQKMYVGGHPGFFRSEDGGDSWSMDNSGLPATDVHGLGMDPGNPDTLYAYVVNEGLYRSEDAGESWERVTANMAVMGPILVDPQDSETLYTAGMDGGFQESVDGGKSWGQVGTIPGGMTTWVSQDRKNPDTFYAASGGRVFESTDGGEGWQPSGEGLPDGISVVEAAPSAPNIVYAGVLEGETARLYVSEDGGESWRASG